MNPAIYVALAVIFLALAPVYLKRSKAPGVDSPQNSRFAGWIFTVVGIAFLIAAAISYFTAD